MSGTLLGLGDKTVNNTKSLPIGLFMRAQLCLSLCDLMDCSLPGSSVHGILQARILELPFSSPRDLPDPVTEPTSLIDIFCLGNRFFTTRAPGKPSLALYCVQIIPPKK